jgi:hypothetical protein
MGIRPLTTLLATAALATAALATGVSATAASAAVSPRAGSHMHIDANYACHGYGTGATLDAAKHAALQDFIGFKTVGPTVWTDGQFADGSWWAEISGDCVFTQ